MERSTSSGFLRPILFGWALLCATGGTHAEDPLYYFIEGERIVITNAPSRVDARPVTKPQAAPAPIIQARKSPATRQVPLPATHYDEFIDRVAAEAGLSPQLIKAVALVESGFDSRAVSPKGAQGLMQLMPATAKSYGVTDPFDPRQNLRAGATHLRGLVDEFDGDLTLALAAYNAGSAAVRRYGGVPRYRETQDYVKRVHARLVSEPASTPRAAPPAVPVRMIHLPDGSITLTN